MSLRSVLLLAVTPFGLAGCATGYSLPPAEVVRYHLGEPLPRGSIAVEAAVTPGVPASLEFKTYAAAVETQLLKNGYALPVQGTRPDLVATVDFTRANRVGPPRRSPISIGIGGGSFGGGRRGGGVGVGGGVGFPIGGGGGKALVETELAVTIKRRVDLSPVWEGRAHLIADPRAADATADALAARLANALFMGFPGESGRTIEVK